MLFFFAFKGGDCKISLVTFDDKTGVDSSWFANYLHRNFYLSELFNSRFRTLWPGWENLLMLWQKQQ